MAIQRGVAPEDIFQIHWVSDVQISPDGALVACVVTQIDDEIDDYRSSIWVVPCAGGVPRRLTNSPKRDTQPRFSPDGSVLAFVRDAAKKDDKDTKPQVWAIRLSGGEAWMLTDLPNGATQPVWSPDGQQIALLSRVSPEDGLSKEDKEKLRARGRVIDRLKYRMNGEGYIYDRPNKVWTVPFSESGPVEARQLTDGDWSDTHPSWSPDGKSLAFTSARHETRDIDGISDIWVVSADGGEPRKITDSQGPTVGPRWSPNGREIAYIGHAYPMGSGYNTKLWAVSVDDGAIRDLTADYDRYVVSPSSGTPPTVHWSKDGSTLLFTALDKGSQPILTVPSGGGPVDIVIGGEREITFFDAPLGVRRIAFIASTATAPAEVFLWEESKGERQLTDFNAEWKSEVYRATPERIVYTSEDGTEVDGWLLKPFGFQPGQIYPVLYNIHGGPHGQYGHTFFDEFQVQVGHGYGVFYPNPRGSQGYGEAFSMAIVGEWGKRDYEDVMAGLDALVRVPWVDGDRIGVLGGSYGGYMTSWVIGHTDRFKVACSERAVNNIYSMYGTSDIGFYFNEWETGGKPFWEAPQYYLDRSPIHYVQHVKTPTLIIHSEGDLRCPIEQGEQLFIALKRRGVDTLFLRFPEENHELSRSGKPSRRIQRFQVQLEWFDKYLRSEPS
jgi:dipeptidyl aminopeptidase/acylaminoacyl peptidase